MSHNDIIPLDAPDLRNHARERLRANLAAALLLDWLITDVETQYPDYFSDLESGFQTGFDYAAKWRDDPKFDGFVPLHGRDGSTIDFWIHQDDLGGLLSRLFPQDRTMRLNLTKAAVSWSSFSTAPSRYFSMISS